MNIETIFIIIGLCVLCGITALIYWPVHVMEQQEKAPILPPPLPSLRPPPLPKPSVSAEEFLAQAKAQAAEELTVSAPTPQQPEEKAPKKSNKLFTVLALCAVFALGGIVGSTTTSRYELLKAGDGRACYRVDRLTGKMWFVVGMQGARPIPER